MANSQKFTLTFDAQLNVNQMKGALSNIQSELNKLKLPAGVDRGLQDTFTKLSDEVKNFENLTNKSSFTGADFKQVEKSATKISDLFSNLQSQVKALGSLSDKELQKLFPADVVNKIQAGEKALNSYQSTIDQLNSKLATANDRLKTLQNKLQVRIQNKDAAQANVDNLTNNAQSINDLAKAEGVKQEIQTYKELEAALNSARQAKANYDQAVANGSRKANSITEAGLNKTISRLEAVKQAYDDQTNAIKTAQQVLTAAKGQVTRTYNEIAEAQLNLTQTQKEAFTGSAAAIQQLFQDLNNAGFDTSKYTADIDGAKQAINEYVEVIRNQLLASIQSVDNALNSNGQAYENNRRKVEENALANQRLDERMRDVSALKSRIQYFFGLSNTINLVKRAIRGAFNTIKELDKAMTATAVVTDFDVGDMWAQLPEYTKRANELGVTTLAAYEAATLYYQQGLKTNEVNALSVETLKMARIAGLDAAEATDRMTNALRGFNMALTEANAQRVDDVYSELAANTASNVDEISTAMTKVASLAHNANMEFETTAAFLAQIIETTRESAETAGTALKTVVARFSEVKKLVDEGTLRGQDEEGQAIDVNKVGAALRTAGIDLNKYFLGEVGLDDIFMELASKWDSLTSLQQRYIATQAAGSRQQSRFIALMSDYARTQELVGKAYNANGAAARQFEKTQESLESKLARLKNAWNEFLMGLTNNQVVKGFVDLLTDLLNTINKVTSAFGEGIGTILKWGIALGGIFGAKSLLASGGLVDKGLITLLSGTGIGNALTKAGILGQTGGVAAGAAGGAVARTPLIFGSGSLLSKAGKGIWGGLQGLGGAAGVSKIPILGKAAGGLETALIGKGATAELAMGLTGVATALGAIVVAVGAVVTAYQVWLHLTPEGQLKQAKAIAEAMNTTAANTQKAAEEMRNASESYKEYNDAVKNARTVEDRNEAIQNRNEYIQSLLEQNESLAQYVSTSQEDGQFVLTINEEQLAAAVKDASKGAAKAAISANFANALQAGKQADVFQARLDRAGVDLEKRRIQTYDEVGNATTREMTDAEYAKYAYYAQAAAEQRSQQRSFAAQAYQQDLADTGLKDDVSAMLSSALVDTFDEDKYLEDINAQKKGWWIFGPREQTLRDEYARLYGSEADSNMDKEQLRKAVAQFYVDQERSEDTQKLAGLLQGPQSDAYKALLEAYNGTGKITELKLEGISTEDLISQLGFDKLSDAQLEEFAKLLGTDAKGLGKHIAAQAEATKNIQAQARANVFEQMMRAGMNITTADQERINQMAPAEVTRINEVATSAEGLLSQEDYQRLFNELINGAIDEEFATQLTNLFSSINLDDPIDAFNKLAKAKTEALQAGNADLALYVSRVQEANAETFTASNLVQSFITSADYESLTESLADFIKENGYISDRNIEELASSNNKLKQLLDSNVVSAKALANALTLIESGKITFDQLNDAMLKALGTGKSFEEVLSDVQKWIEDFNKGTDLKLGTEHIISELEELGKYVENWEFGNEPTEAIYDHIFGEGSYQKLVERFGNDFEAFETFVEGKISKYTSMAENAGQGGIEKAAEKGISGLRKISGKGGEFFEWDLSQYSSTTEAIDEVAKALQVSQGAAESFILSWQTHIPKLRTEWDQLNFETQLQTYIENLGEAKIATEQDLIALGAAVDETGHVSAEKLQEIIDKINKARREAGKAPIEISAIVNWQDKSGTALSGEDLLSKYKEQFGSKNGEPITVTIPVMVEGDTYTGSTIQSTIDNAYKDLQQYINKASNTVDSEGLISHLLSQGLSQGQAETVANDFVSELNGAMLTKTIQVPEFKTDENGNTIEVTQKDVTISADTMDGLRQAEEAALQKANYSLVAQGLAGVSTTTFQSNVTSATANGVQNGASEGWQNFVDGLSPLSVPVTFTDETAHAATGGIVKSFAGGSAKTSLSPGFALTGEEGPEIVWNKNEGYAYVTGGNGPEFQNLRPGDRVFNAAETSRILRNSSFARGGIFDSYASGGWKPTNKKNGGGGSGGSGSGSGSKDSEKESTWRNELDWLYNLMEDIVELERDQKEIEEEYEDLLKDQTKTGGDLYRLLVKQLGNLYTQLDHQNFALRKREQEMREFMDKTNDQDKYLWYNWKDRTLEIDWDAIDKIQDEEQYKHVKELVDEAEAIQDKIDDADDSIMDITNQIQELENIWRDTFTDFEDRVLDAIIKSYQQIIDNYSELNDTLNNSNSQILDSLQKQISLERQIRDNTKTEEEITDEEARLAYLRRDTSGGNDLSALQLEQELADQRQDYEDTLVDQAISRLQEDNDAAAQQRERQIEIMQAQLDYQSENGEFNAYVSDLLTSAMGADGELLTNSDLVTLLKEQENWDAMSAVSKEVWDEELNGTFKEVAAFLLKQNAEENGTFYTALTAAVKSVSSAIGSYSQAMTKMGSQIASATSGGGSSSGGGGSSGGRSGRGPDKGKDGMDYENELIPMTKPRYEDLTTSAAIKEKLKLKKMGRANGGLVSQTGIGMLHGTIDEPEYVLNARQTDAFLKLADILPSVMSDTLSTTSNTFGSTYVNLSVNLESVSPDYDVDRMVSLVKDKLYDSSMYRNNNVLSFLR